MNKLQSSTYETNSAPAIKKMQRLVMLASIIGFGLYSLGFAPLYAQLSANVVYQEAFVTYLLYYAMTAVEIAVFMVVFPATVYAVWRGGLKGSRSVWITFFVATFGKYLLNFIMSCITDGSVPAWDYFVSYDMPFILPNLLMELGQYAIILFMAVLIVGKRKKAWQMDVLVDGDKAGNLRSVAFPVTKLFALKNPVLAASFANALFLLIARVFSHLIYQLSMLIYGGQTEGALVIASDMISDFLLAAILYFVSVLLLSSFDRREMQDLAQASKGSST